MGFLDWIKQLFSSKKTSVLTSEDLTKVKGEDTPLSVFLSDKDGNALSNREIKIKVNNKVYQKITDINGVATLNINLSVGAYDTLLEFEGDTEYNNARAFNHIVIKPLIDTTDLVMTQGDGSKFECICKDVNNYVLEGCKVTFYINDKYYDKSSNNEGVASLGINLNAGNYHIITNSFGSTATNTITINEPAPQPQPEPEKDCDGYYEHILNMDEGCSGYAQCTGYYCACNALQSCFYKLTGVLVAESTIADWAGTTTSGTGHSGINTAIYKFNQKYGTNLEIEWANFGDLGFDKLGCIMSQDHTAVFTHILYRNQYGHYEVPRIINTTTNSIQVYNSLGNRSGQGYVGYLENRSFSTQQSYFNGISQPSVAIIRDKS